jgi:glycosyltransferase involved in cell wall biosynthesis
VADNVLENSLVSIVLPTYKRAHVLPNAIRSVLNQTYENLELIIVDDNSPDNTPEVIKSFSDKRIRYVRNDPNLKLPKALNKGFSLAQGNYLTWTSDDNMFADNAIEKMVKLLQTRDCNFVYGDYYLFSEQNGEGLPLDIHHDKLPDQLQLEKGNHIGACFMYTRRVYEEIGDYDPELFLVEDYDYFIRASQRFRFCHIPEALYYFRRDSNTLYLSRFSEVKASDVLVRYKNGLLSEEGLLDAVIVLLLRNIDGLTNPLLRWTHSLVRNKSFRLTQFHRKLATEYLRRQLQGQIHLILQAYSSKHASFGESRDALIHLMNKSGQITYVRP